MAKSEYLNNWEEYIIENELKSDEVSYVLKSVEPTEDAMFRFILNLIM